MIGNVHQDDVFLDISAGLGNVAAQFAIQTNARQCLKTAGDSPPRCPLLARSCGPSATTTQSASIVFLNDFLFDETAKLLCRERVWSYPPFAIVHGIAIPVEADFTPSGSSWKPNMDAEAGSLCLSRSTAVYAQYKTIRHLGWAFNKSTRCTCTRLSSDCGCQRTGDCAVRVAVVVVHGGGENADSRSSVGCDAASVWMPRMVTRPNVLLAEMYVLCEGRDNTGRRNDPHNCAGGGVSLHDEDDDAQLQELPVAVAIASQPPCRLSP
ncbi:S-adenosyl-L-methionine-dependent methyltransferase [Phytophthora cactorum]|nr:S-adenosyl-L-methionine-dependent methyltransferase [Phytophthora cactorum]